MKQVKAIRNPIWVVLVLAAMMLSSGVAYADAGGYAGTYGGSYAKASDAGVYEETTVSNTNGLASTVGSKSGKQPSDYLNGFRENIENAARALESDERMNSTSGSSSSSAVPGTNAHTLHYSLNGYHVYLPAYWDGRVTVSQPDTTGTTLEVRSKKYPSRVLCRISVASSSERVNGGDIGNPTVEQVRLRDERVVVMRATNYSWIVTSASENMSEAEAAELIDLTTGGKTRVDCERASRNGDNLVSANWVADNVSIMAE